MKIIKWDPFHDTESLFEDDLPLTFQDIKLGFDLAADVYESNGNIIANISIPDIDPEKLNISIEDDLLKISGSREEKKEEKKKNYYCKEIKRGSFQRTIQLPSPVIANKAKAEYKDGILKIEAPKKVIAPESQVKIKVTKK